MRKNLSMNTQLEILLVISKYLPEYTGAAFRIDALYRRLKEQSAISGITILCNSTSEKKSLIYSYEGVKVKRIVCPFRFSWLPQRVANALKTYYEAALSFLYLQKAKPQCLHIAGSSGATCAAILYGRLYKIPRFIELVTREASPYQYLPGLHYPQFLQLHKNTVIAAISQQLAERCKKQGLNKNIWCRPNPVNEQKFTPCCEKTKMELRTKISPFTQDDITITMVAKFMPQKNQLFLLDVLKHLPEHYKLLLAGPRVDSGIFKDRDTQYFNTVRETITKDGLEGRVHLREGFVNADEYMKASDIYVMPQYNEGLGTPMLEAIACAVPVVANKNEPAFTQWIRDGQNGYLSTMEPQDWAENIIKAGQIRRETLEAQAQKIHDSASITRSDKAYMALFHALTGAEPGEEIDISHVI